MGHLTQITFQDGTFQSFDYVDGHLDSGADELGRTTDYETDALGRVTKIILPAPEPGADRPEIDYTYNALDQITGITLPDPDGEGMGAARPQYGYGYNSRGILEWIQEPDPDSGTSGALTEYTYDERLLLVRVTDVHGGETDHEYDAVGRLIRSTLPDPDGDDGMDPGMTLTPLARAEIEYHYDSLDRLTKVVEADPETGGIAPGDSPETLYEYNLRGWVTKITDAEGRQTEFDYDNVGNLTWFQDANGHETKYVYDNLDRLLEIQRPDPISGLSGTGPVDRLEFDLLSRLIAETDPLGRVTEYEYNARNWLTQITPPDPEGDTLTGLDAPVTIFEYDAVGNLVWEQDVFGRQTDYHYDDLDRLTKLELPPETTVAGADRPDYEYAYDGLGRLILEKDPLDYETAYEYDGAGRLKKLLLPDPDDGTQTADSPDYRYHYNAAGDLLWSKDPLGRTTSYGYDLLGRTTSVSIPGQGTTQYAYDYLSRVTTETDPFGKDTTYDYDKTGRLLEITQPAITAGAPTTKFEYDGVGNLTKLTDPVGNQTTYDYDALDRLTDETLVGIGTRTYDYDLADRLTTRTDRRDWSIDFTYDDLDRLVGEEWYGAGGSSTNSVTYTYDELRLLWAADDFSRYDYEYDNLDRTVSVDNSAGPNPGQPDIKVKYEYNLKGEVTQTQAKEGATVRLDNDYTYYATGWLKQVTQSIGVGAQVDFTYNDAGQFDTITRYDDPLGTNEVATTKYTYDNGGRLEWLDHDLWGTTDDIAYRMWYDVGGRVTRVRYTHTAPVDNTRDYVYDDIDQLITVTESSQTTESYNYDKSGNRSNTGYTTGPANRITSDGTYNYQYDAEGNLTRKEEIANPSQNYTEYTWDNRNRLVLIEPHEGGTTEPPITYTYDVFDRRISKKVAETGSDRWEYFVYDGADVILVYDETGSLTTTYLHGPATDQVLAAKIAGETLWYFADHLGTVRDVGRYDLIGFTTGPIYETVIVNHLVYDSFGKIESQTDDAYEPVYAFTGREWDADAGLYYYRARWYDAGVGRFVSEDFIPDDVENTYRYVGNSPTNATDPSGLAKWLFPGDRRASWDPRVTLRLWFTHTPVEHLRGIYTGETDIDMHTTPAMDGAGGSYTKNAGNAHVLMEIVDEVDPTGVVAAVPNAILTKLEGKHLNAAAMANANPVLVNAKNGVQEVCQVVNAINVVKQAKKGVTKSIGAAADDAGDIARDATKRKGPYAHLEGTDNIKVKKGGRYKQRQKEKVLDENERMNDGVIFSDEPKDMRYGQPLERPPKGPFEPGQYPEVPPNQAQVDHYIPRVDPNTGKPLGENSYSNARVVSAEYNNSKRNRLPE